MKLSPFLALLFGHLEKAEKANSLHLKKSLISGKKSALHVLFKDTLTKHLERLLQRPLTNMFVDSQMPARSGFISR